MAGPTRILLIRPSALGDVCRTVPALASLRRAHPSAQIDWLVQDAFADAIRHHPALTTPVPFPRASMGRALRSLHVAPLMEFIETLEQPRYDLVLDLQGLARSGLFAWFTGSPRRLGYADARELAWLGLTERIPVHPALHTVDRMLALTAAAGVEITRDMRLYADPAEREWVQRDSRLHAAPYVVVAPTSRWPAKRWPAERFAAVAQHLAARGFTIVLVGGKSERDQCAPLMTLAASTPGVIDLIGQTSIARLMALIESSALTIANDSAALHMAVGFDRPIVALYGPTRVDLVGPYLREADVLQHIIPGDRFNHKDPANMAPMLRITADEVIAAADTRLTNDASRR